MAKLAQRLSTYTSTVHPGISIQLQHSVEDVAHVQEVVLAYRPSIIVELGCGTCGLTLAMREVCPSHVPIVAVDSFPRPQVPNDRAVEVFGRQTWIVRADTITEESFAVTQKLISGTPSAMMYLDCGGIPDRMRVLEHYGWQLTEGALIGLHDVSAGVREADVERMFGEYEMPTQRYMWPEDRDVKTSARFWRIGT